MRAVYNIFDCCGDILDTVEVELPVSINDPTDFEAEQYALDQSDYANPGICGDCRGYTARASYYGFPIEPVKATVMIEAKDRMALIETLETLLREVRALPDYVSFITCNSCNSIIG